MQVFLIILCRKVMFHVEHSPFSILFLSFSYLQYNNKPKSWENASVLSKKLIKICEKVDKRGQEVGTNSHPISSSPHFSPLFPTTGNLVPYFILLFIFITSIGARSLQLYKKMI